MPRLLHVGPRSKGGLGENLAVSLISMSPSFDGNPTPQKILPFLLLLKKIKIKHTCKHMYTYTHTHAWHVHAHTRTLVQIHAHFPSSDWCISLLTDCFPLLQSCATQQQPLLCLKAFALLPLRVKTQTSRDMDNTVRSLFSPVPKRSLLLLISDSRKLFLSEDSSHTPLGPTGVPSHTLSLLQGSPLLICGGSKKQVILAPCPSQ